MLREKQFSSFDVAAVVQELRQDILDSRVRNVYQLGIKTLLFKLRKHSGRVSRLVLESGKRLHLTSYSREKPKFPPPFCMALRKYLRNCWLIDVEQHEFERIVLLKFKTWAGEMRLCLEFFGDGNAILVDEDDKILHALTYRRMRDRNIIRGETFRFPPPIGRNPIDVRREEFVDILRDSGDVEVVRALVRSLSIGGFYAEEVLSRSEVDKKTICDELSDSALNRIFDELQGLLSKIIDGDFDPCIISEKDDDFVDVIPFMLKQYEGFKRQCHNSFNKALDEFYVRVCAIERALTVASAEVESLRREAERLNRIIERQEKALDTAETKANKNKHIGDTIYAHTGELKALLLRFSDAKKKGKDWDEVIPEILADKEAGVRPGEFFYSFDEKHSAVNVDVDGLRFSLSLGQSLFDNAARFYKRYKRAKQKLEGAKTALKESRKKLGGVEARLKKAEAAKEVRPDEVFEEVAERKIKRKRWFEKFRWFITSDGFLVVAGKDAVSNEVLVNKYAKDEDVVFHADVVGAPFVMVKTEGKKPSLKGLQQAGVFAASFSRGWREGFASVDVYWVKPEQLSKGAPSGEYVPRGGFVVRGKRNWMRGTPLKLAVGVIKEESDEIKFVGGPVDSVEPKTSKYVTIVPGGLEDKTLFKAVLKSLARQMPKAQQEKVSKSSFEEIREFIPYSKGRILKD